MWDVIVVGASIAGCASALSLSKQGLRVLLLDKAARGRDKACGEGLLPAGVAVLERLGALSAVTKQCGYPIHGVGFQLEEQLARAAFPMGQGLGMRRQRFDDAFASYVASQPNVELREKTTVEGLLFDNVGAVCGVRLRGGAEERARMVVGADGLGSPLRKQSGLDGGQSRRRRFGIRVHFGLPSALPFGHYVHVLLDHPGEFYLTPVGERMVQVAYLGDSLTERGFSGSRYVEAIRSHKHLGKLFSGASVESDVMGAGPFGRKTRAVVRDGFALVGDAAGYVDAVTGEGMELALRSAEMLGPVVAQALASGGPTAKNLRGYATQRAQIVRDPDRLTKLLLLLEGYPFLARRAIAVMQEKPVLFQKLLLVQGGEAPLSSLSLLDWANLLWGRSPRSLLAATASGR